VAIIALLALQTKRARAKDYLPKSGRHSSRSCMPGFQEPPSASLKLGSPSVKDALFLFLVEVIAVVQQSGIGSLSGYLRKLMLS
jgi:hypothetical protein